MFGPRTYQPNSAKHPDAVDDNDNVNDTYDPLGHLDSVCASSRRTGTARRTSLPLAPLAWPKGEPTTGQHLSQTLPSSLVANSKPDALPNPADASCRLQSHISGQITIRTRPAALHPRRVLFSFHSTSTSAVCLLVSFPTIKTKCAMLEMATTYLSA